MDKIVITTKTTVRILNILKLPLNREKNRRNLPVPIDTFQICDYKFDYRIKRKLFEITVYLHRN